MSEKRESKYQWSAWLDYVQQREVVPILGPEIVTVEDDGQTVGLDFWIARRLAEKYSVPFDPTAGADALNLVVSTILREGTETEAIVYADVRDLVRDSGLKPSESLRKLARITDFNLFVTTTFDPLMEIALNEERFQGQAKTVVIRNSLRKVEDLPEGYVETSGTTLVYLMGRMSTPPYFALTENDKLEFFCRLQNRLTRPERLFSLLKEKHLLVLGGKHPDWAGLFLLRTVRNDHLSKRANPTIETIADGLSSGDHRLAWFIRHFSKSTAVYPEGGSIAFIDELHKKWSQLRGGDSVPAAATAPQMPVPHPQRAIFISYAHEDQTAAHELKTQLERRGYDVWMDMAELQGGDNYSRKIATQIDTCAVFIPVISRHTEARREGWFRKEWTRAIERLAYMHKDVPFLHPVTVDDTSAASARWVPDEFKTYQWTSCPDGVPPPRFLAHVFS